MNKKFFSGVVLAVAATTMTVLPATAEASPQQLCPDDRPCITSLYQDGKSIKVGWDGHEDFSHYNFRWSRPGRADSQHETSGGGGGGFTINKVWSSTTYTVKVQGCNKPLFGSSTCTPWAEETITTR